MVKYYESVSPLAYCKDASKALERSYRLFFKTLALDPENIDGDYRGLGRFPFREWVVPITGDSELLC